MSTAVAPSVESSTTHAARLDRLAAVAIEVGLGLARGQELVMTASLDALPLVRRITEHAYRAGASLVTTFYSDDEACWRVSAMRPMRASTRAARGCRTGSRRRSATAPRAWRLPARIPRCWRRRTRRRWRGRTVPASKASRPAMELITRHAINWTIVAAATPAWAQPCSPASRRTWRWRSCGRRSLPASRVDAPDPVAAWRAHDARTAQARGMLNEQRLQRAALPRAGNRSAGGAGGRACVDGRRHDGGQWPVRASRIFRRKRSSRRRTSERVDGMVTQHQAALAIRAR